MDNIKNDDYYLNKIIENIEFAIEHTDGISFDNFVDDVVLVNAVMFSFIQISENVGKLSDAFKASFTDRELHQIKAIRNRIVHEYEIVNEKIIYDTVKNDLPELLSKIKTRR